MFFALVVAWVGFVAITITAFTIARHVEHAENVRQRKHVRLYDQGNER